MDNIFIKVVKIAVIAKSELEAHLSISEYLNENLDQSSNILDWDYQDSSIINKGEFKQEDYTNRDMNNDNLM